MNKRIKQLVMNKQHKTPWHWYFKFKKSYINPITDLEGPWRFQDVEAPRFQDTRHMKVVRLSTLRTGRLYRQDIFLVFISVRGWVDLRKLVGPERLCQWIIPMTASGIEPATFWLVAQCLNQLRHQQRAPPPPRREYTDIFILIYWRPTAWCQIPP